MNKKVLQFSICVLAALLVFSCSRKKDKWVNRNWHDLTTKNNTLYNGRVAYDLGQQEIVQNYKDNFWELLPVERLTVSEDVRINSEVFNPNFEKAEEKAAKAIQKHSMFIDGKERNPKMDESFLLLGKARYFEERFIPAIEAFNYILYKYPSSNTINHAKVWRAKTNIRLDNNELAIENLERLLRYEELDMAPQDYADATAILSQAYTNLSIQDTAVAYINLAAKATPNNEEKGRYLFIKGQLYNQLEQKDSANLAFDEVIELNRRTPRRYMINAYIAKIRNFDYDTEDRIALLELLDDLEENRENRPFLDIIYYQKAEYFRTLDSVALSVDYYNKSLRTETTDKILQSKNYKTLGDIKFDYKEYALAGAYYDSTLERMNENSKKYRILKKKRVNLDDVILYEGIANANDSILTVVAMSPNEKIAYYQKYTDSLKVIAVAEEKAAEIARIKGELPAETRFKQPGAAAFERAKGPNQGTAFYFYNPTTVAFGKTAFKKKFGNRELVDNWKLASISNPEIAATEDTEEEEEYSIDTDPTFDPQTYIAQLPTEPKVLDSLATDRNFAYYQLGVIYKEKFLEYQLAQDKLETLLVSNPEERLIVPAKYNLYKIYEVVGDTFNTNKMKQDIINNHSDTRYAKILQNPEENLKGDESSPYFLYNKLYKEFENENYALVIKQSEELITKFAGEDVVPKFELLKARAIGRYRGFEAYKEALNYVSLNYPQSPEGKKAQFTYGTALAQMEANTFLEDKDDKLNHKVVYEFPIEAVEQMDSLKSDIEKILKELRYDKMKVSIDPYIKDKKLVVVHARRDMLGTEGLGELLALGQVEDTRNADLTRWNRKKKFYPRIVYDYVSIGSDNYRIVQIHKNMDAYKTKYSLPQESNNIEGDEVVEPKSE